MKEARPYRIKSITEIHRLMGLPKPHHPLISWVQLGGLQAHADIKALLFDHYVIILKKGCDKLYYGQQRFDFDEGLMAFMSPGQILRGEKSGPPENLAGWMLFIHPDFLWNTSLAKKIRQYDYFDYATNEALFLSDKEESLVNGIVEHIKNEYETNIDKFSQDIIIAHLETLLNYAERFYQRQFLTRKKSNHQVLDRLEQLMHIYFNNEALLSKGLPTVQYISDQLNISQSYLRGLLKALTGQSTQQYIHEKLIDKAKEKLSTTNLSVSEIAYEMGFEHPQSFSKLFKSKTKQSPLAFRAAFNG